MYRGLVLSDSTWLLISDSTFSKFRKFWSKISDYGLKNLQNFGPISDSTQIFILYKIIFREVQKFLIFLQVATDQLAGEKVFDGVRERNCQCSDIDY